MSTANKNLLLLFERPREPVMAPKGPNKTVLEVPEKHRGGGFPKFSARSGFDTNVVPLKTCSMPDLGDILDLDRDSYFSLFIPKHQRLAAKLIDIFMDQSSADDLLAVAACLRDKVNPYFFNYALSVAILHRPDTEDLNLPTVFAAFPDKYVDAKTLSRAKEHAAMVEAAQREPVDLEETRSTATDLEVEHRVAYFREDLGVNLHHWHWHLVYPYQGQEKIVKKDRRGELFYYMHQQIIARYNFERFCNGMRRVGRFNDWRKPIDEGYFPKLDKSVSSTVYPGRVANLTIRDVDRDGFKQDVDDMTRWRDRIFAAIYQGSVVEDCGCVKPLTEKDGINTLGNMVESSILSPNRAFYGDLHNMGHVFIAAVHDPDHRHGENLGVMGDTATAMRDPLFYRWHAFIDDMFLQYKATLPPYPEDQLSYPGVRVTDVEVQPKEGDKNTFCTFWEKSAVDLSKGLDFQASGPVLVRFKHLQHQPFTYKITVVNESRGSKRGTCRIFLAPKCNEHHETWTFDEQRAMFVELDKFTVTLRQGQNIIERDSTKSSVTIPFERTFYNLNDNDGAGDKYRFCGCGWPQHMLIPRGTVEGFDCDLFVMISNYEGDEVEEDCKGNCPRADSYDAGSFCGLKNKLYPDRRAMGFPFDRKAVTEQSKKVEVLGDFLRSNMKVQKVTIKYSSNEVVLA